MSVAFPFRVYGENGCAVEGWRHERNPFFFLFVALTTFNFIARI